MRRSAGIFICLLAWLLTACLCAAQVDSARLAALDGRLEQYFKTLEPEKIEVKNRECDTLIVSAKDSALRRHIALKIYDHYLESPVMGDEAVAIHMTDRWFATGKIDMGGEQVLLNAKIYADFNRQSLLGMQAPVIEMTAPDGGRVTVGGRSDRYTVLFFFDTDCAKCRLETILLRSKLNQRNWPVDFYAIYTGTDAAAWKEWREQKFAVTASRTKVTHLWDPEVESDFQMKYGVIQTPRMFLLDKSGTIVGRGLDTSALDRLLGIFLSDAPYEYGGAASAALMDKLFGSYGTLEAGNVMDVAEILEDRTLAKGDTTFFKHLEGDLLYWLTSRRDEACKEGTLPFINEYVLSRPGIWNTQDDTLKVVGLARMMGDLLSRTPVGSKLPVFKHIQGWKKLRSKGCYIVFHSQGCPVCREELAAADSLGFRTLDVDVDAIMASDPELGRSLLDTFDLSSLPFIIEVGKRGVVRRRYVSLLGGAD